MTLPPRLPSCCGCVACSPGWFSRGVANENLAYENQKTYYETSYGTKVFREGGHEAMVLMQTAAYLSDNIPAGRWPLLINFDESPIPVAFERIEGNISHPSGERQLDAPRSSVSRADRRRNFTYIAFVCDDPAVQPHLPHIVYIKDDMLNNRGAEELEEHLPDNWFVVRKQTGWNTAGDMVEIYRLLHRVLSNHAPNRQPIIYCDCARCHLHADVLRQAAHAHFWVVVVPAQCTWFLQPLDVYVFARLKQRLKEVTAQRRSIVTFGNKVSNAIRNLITASEEVVTNRDWSRAFLRLGLDGNVAPSASLLKKACDWTGDIPPVPRGRPTDAELRLTWPLRTRVPMDDLRAVMPLPAAAPLLALPVPPPAPHHVAPAPDPGALPPPRRRLRLV